MIVDDEKTTRESLERYIPWGSLGVGRVQIARNGAEALALAAHTPPDILLTDVRMPRLDGLELAQRVREIHPAMPHRVFKRVRGQGILEDRHPTQGRGIHREADRYRRGDEDRPRGRHGLGRGGRGPWRGTAHAKALQDDACLVREQIVRRLVNGCATLDELRSVFVGALPAFEPQTCFTAATAALRWTRPLPEGERAGIRHRLLIACSGSSARGDAPSFIGFVDTDLLAIVLARRMSPAQPQSRTLYEELIKSMRDISDGNLAATLGVGSTVIGWQNIPESYAKARAATSLSFYRCGDSLLFGDRREPRVLRSATARILAQIRAACAKATWVRHARSSRAWWTP